MQLLGTSQLVNSGVGDSSSDTEPGTVSVSLISQILTALVIRTAVIFVQVSALDGLAAGQSQAHQLQEARTSRQ